MKHLFIFLLCLYLFNNSFAQSTTVKGKFPSLKGGIVTISRPTRWLVYDTPKISDSTTKINDSGEFSLNLDFIDKEMVIVEINDNTGEKTLYKQFLYLKKGYSLSLLEDSQDGIIITGVGADDNHLKGIETHYSIETEEQDSLPDRMYQKIQTFYNRDKTIVDSIAKIYKLSANCSLALNYHLKYARLASFYHEYGNIRIGKRDEVGRNLAKWEALFDSLQNEAERSDENALAAPSYHSYLRTFLQRKYEDVQVEYYDKPQDFYRTWFDNDSLTANAAMQKDPVNQLKQKIIEKYFTGKVKEQMYAFLFDSMVEEQLFDNAGPLFSDFKRQFPKSEFIGYFEKPFNRAIAQAKNTLTDKMVFLDKVKSWDDILTRFKGKTVLLDMWGTWCGPCRQEINEHAAALKQHFAGKNVSFLYIANFDRDIEKWKQLIAFYNMEGNHILASRDFTAEIMEKIKGYGYPTYAIIDKYGKVELSKANSPLNRKVLIQQIEEALGR